MRAYCLCVALVLFVCCTSIVCVLHDYCLCVAQVLLADPKLVGGYEAEVPTLPFTHPMFWLPELVSLSRLHKSGDAPFPKRTANGRQME